MVCGGLRRNEDVSSGEHGQRLAVMAPVREVLQIALHSAVGICAHVSHGRRGTAHSTDDHPLAGGFPDHACRGVAPVAVVMVVAFSTLGIFKRMSTTIKNEHYNRSVRALALLLFSTRASRSCVRLPRKLQSTAHVGRRKTSSHLLCCLPRFP